MKRWSASNIAKQKKIAGRPVAGGRDGQARVRADDMTSAARPSVLLSKYHIVTSAHACRIEIPADTPAEALPLVPQAALSQLLQHVQHDTDCECGRRCPR